MVVRNIIIQFWFGQFQVNCFNPLLYPGIVRVRPSPECGVIVTWIEDLNVKNRPFIVYTNMCLQTIENQHTISYHIKVGYYLLLFSSFFCSSR